VYAGFPVEGRTRSVQNAKGLVSQFRRLSERSNDGHVWQKRTAIGQAGNA